MKRVGKAMRKAYKWVDISAILYLNMDNAGGHGTNVAVDEYTKMLKTDYNIEIISPSPKVPLY